MKKHGESRIAQVNDGTIERHLVPIRPSIRLLVFAVLVLTGLAYAAKRKVWSKVH